MNKKIIVCIYYTGLILGIILINYMIKYHVDFTEYIMSGFTETDKLCFIDGQELFFYLFLKRIKQISLFFLLYFFLSKPISLLILDLYYAFIVGMCYSLFAYYYPFVKVLGLGLTILPHFICFIIVEIAGWRYFDNNKTRKKLSVTNAYLFTIVVVIVFTIVELNINLKIMPLILNYK